MSGPIEVGAHALGDGTVIGPDLRPIGFAPLAGDPVTSDQLAPTPVQTTAEARDRAAMLVRQLTGAVRDYSSNRPRSRQRSVGPSEVGSPCDRRLGYKLAGVPAVNPDGGDPWAAFVGTATHAELERVFTGKPGWATEVRVQVDDELELAGSCDLIRLTDGVTIIDHKVVGITSLRKARAQGPSDTYRVQANLYATGFIRAGVPVEWVAIAYWAKAGRLTDLYVWVDRYDQDVAERGLERLSTLRQIAALGPAAVAQLPKSEHFCDGCAWFRPGEADASVACCGPS